MNKKKVLTISILPIMWIIYFLFELISGRLKTSYEIIMTFIPSVVFALIGYLIYLLWEKYKDGLNKKRLVIIFFVLMLLDQGIKLIIKIWFFNDRFDIIKDFLSFHPIINTEGSWINARFGAGLNFGFLIIINLIALFLFTEFYRYYLSNGKKDFFADLTYVFISAGALCSLIDKVFYGGSLDFIGIGNLFIADFKDIYINLAIFFFILTIYFNDYLSEEDSSFKDDINSIKRFFSFIGKDIKTNLLKRK